MLIHYHSKVGKHFCETYLWKQLQVSGEWIPWVQLTDTSARPDNHLTLKQSNAWTRLELSWHFYTLVYVWMKLWESHRQILFPSGGARLAASSFFRMFLQSWAVQLLKLYTAQQREGTKMSLGDMKCSSITRFSCKDSYILRGYFSFSLSESKYPISLKTLPWRFVSLTLCNVSGVLHCSLCFQPVWKVTAELSHEQTLKVCRKFYDQIRFPFISWSEVTFEILLVPAWIKLKWIRSLRVYPKIYLHLTFLWHQTISFVLSSRLMMKSHVLFCPFSSLIWNNQNINAL